MRSNIGSTHDSSEPYVIVSADCHAGADVLGYKPYLPAGLHEEFDAWASTFHDGWVEIDPRAQKGGVASGTNVANWDSEMRVADLEADGVAGEVLFPNTAPPFFPSGALTAPSPRNASEYALRWAGLKAHNRWMVDFCSELPGRRAGIAQILLFDVDDAIAEIEWSREAGLTGGILLPAVEPGSGLPALHSRRYERIWSACAELGIPVNHHTAAAGVPIDEDGTAAGRAVAALEVHFFAHRALWHLIFGGVFERHPELRLVLTEQFVGWVPQQLKTLDSTFSEAQIVGSNVHMFCGEAVKQLSMTPSEYFQQNCLMGASFMLPTEVPLRHEIGVDKIMWGCDYPHSEGTTPLSREALRASFAGVPVDECRRMFGETAARVYGLDWSALRAVANRIGPTPEEISQPLARWPVTPTETTCPVFSANMNRVANGSATVAEKVAAR